MSCINKFTFVTLLYGELHYEAKFGTTWHIRAARRFYKRRHRRLMRLEGKAEIQRQLAE